MELPAHTAAFQFLGRLSTLPGCRAEQLYRFNGQPSLKDAIEAQGVPHVEVGPLLLNGAAATLSSGLFPGSSVVVGPDEQPWPEARFVLDVHLGKLARALRLLGFDSAYQNDYSDPQLVAIAVADDRALLTRDVGLLKHRVLTRGYWLRSQQAEEQVHELLLRYGLRGQVRPFARCLACNGVIAPVSEADVRDKIPPKVLGFRQEFFRCPDCLRVYWKGTHYERMQQFIQRITGHQ
ncbi:Mut7-C RNAse domain-containing protein [Flaviaesturariibacter terrae]